MTIPPPLLLALAEDTSPLPRQLTPGPDGTAAECTHSDAPLTEAAFRWQLANDGAANDKLAAGLRAFAGDTARLLEVLQAHPGWQ
jgi:transaldolase